MFRFYIEQDENEYLVLKDASLNTDTFMPKISSMLLSISSPYIPNGIVDELDILNYMATHRTDDELYTITPSTLGLDTSTDIPDGIYKFAISINNTETITLSAMVLKGITAEIVSLVNEVDVNIDIEDDTIFNSNLPLDVKDSKIYYIIAVYFKLLTLTSDDSNIVEANDLIDKLKRLLLIVNGSI